MATSSLTCTDTCEAGCRLGLTGARFSPRPMCVGSLICIGSRCPKDRCPDMAKKTKPPSFISIPCASSRGCGHFLQRWIPSSKRRYSPAASVASTINLKSYWDLFCVTAFLGIFVVGFCDGTFFYLLRMICRCQIEWISFYAFS